MITFQQTSPQCGDYSTHQPYLTELMVEELNRAFAYMGDKEKFNYSDC